MIRNYSRWSARPDGTLVADLLGVRDEIAAHPDTGTVTHGDLAYCPPDLTSAPATAAESAAASS